MEVLLEWRGAGRKQREKAPRTAHTLSTTLAIWNVPALICLCPGRSSCCLAPRNQVPLKTEGCTRQGENLRLVRVGVFLDLAPDFPNEHRDLSQLHAAQDSPSAGDGVSAMDAHLPSGTKRQETGAGCTLNFLRSCRRPQQHSHGSRFCHQSLRPRELLNGKVLTGLWSL